LRRLGERLVGNHMDEVAPKVEPAAVEWIRTIFLGEKGLLL
jgi:hypothetical protein